MHCEECDVKIPEARIKARPNARTCVGCQEGLEKSGDFTRHRMEITQDIESWQCVGVHQILKKGTEVS